MGDRDRIRWDDWDSAGDQKREQGDDGDGTGPTRRARLALALVLTTALLASIVLCCVAAGKAGQLLWLELPPP